MLNPTPVLSYSVAGFLPEVCGLPKYLGEPGPGVPSADSGVAGWRESSHLRGESPVMGEFHRTALGVYWGRISVDTFS